MNDQPFEYSGKRCKFRCEKSDFSLPIIVSDIEYIFIPIQNEQGVHKLPKLIINDVAEMIGYHAVNIRPNLKSFSGYDYLNFELSPPENFYGNGY